MKAILMLLPFCFSLSAFAQDGPLRDTASLDAEQLRAAYSRNKEYPENMEKLVLYTLSFFPELKDHKVVFKTRSKGAPLSSRPQWGTLWRSASKRKYMVFIRAGKDSSMFSSLFSRSSIPAQIGILGHELCHVVEFSNKSSIGLVGLGVAHISKPYMDRFEFRTDSAVIARGMGLYLREWAMLFDKMFAGSSDPFKNKNTPTGERYMSARTIDMYMRRSRQVGGGRQ